MDAIINGKLIVENALITDKVVVFEDKIIDLISESEINKYPVHHLYDAKGCYVSPGFIDIHTHGAVGHDTMDGDWEGIREISVSFASHGVTSFLPTTMTMDRDHIKRALKTIEKAALGVVKKASDQVVPGAKVLGCHLEGPFISPQNAGAQNPSFILKPDFELLENFKGLVKVVTMAPELEGSEDFIKKCVEHDIVISLGHSSGTYGDAMRAIRSGARSISHTFNAMTALNHREPGIVGAAMDRDEVTCELIADNIHIHPAVQRILLKTKGIERVILVTDSMRASGMGKGVYDLGGQTVIVENDSARLENGTLAGSILTMDRALRNFKKNTGISIAEAVKTVTENPAKLLKMDDIIGSIGFGKSSDLVIFDDDFTVLYTFVNGNLSFTKS